jgi:hypothetical protein
MSAQGLNIFLVLAYSTRQNYLKSELKVITKEDPLFPMTGSLQE